ncbi:MAG: S8 family serine peptidase [Vicingus serpentipes]|nr:S8 family serine peptidase [Vicingus serpentipes]
MKHFLLLLSLVLSFSLEGYSQVEFNYSTTTVIVKFHADSKMEVKHFVDQSKFSNSALNSINKKYPVKKIKEIGNQKLTSTYVIEFKGDYDISKLIEDYMNTGLFEYVEPNYIGYATGKKGSNKSTLPNDTYFSRQYALLNDGSFSLSTAIVDADIDMDLAWDIEQGDTSIIVAVLDGGAKLDHPEFSGRIWTNTNEIADGSDSDGNGYVDDTKGWDFAYDDNNPVDDWGHGTNVAGIIGANGNNNIGYAGIDWNCKLMICKVIDQNGSGLYSWWSSAIYYAVDNGADVINMSLAGTSYSTTLKNAVDYAYNNGVVVVASMGNANNSTVQYPAGYTNAIAIGSTNARDWRSSPFFWGGGSSYGSHIDVVAPGSYIYGLDYQSNTNYNTYWGGTSQAAPMVSGVSALLLAKYPAMTPDDIRNTLRGTAEDQVGKFNEDVAGFDDYMGYGRINAYQALQQPIIANIEKRNLNDLDFFIYPNPTVSYLNVLSIKKNQSVRVINVQGTVVFEEKVVNEVDSIKIDVNSYSRGIYIVQVLGENNYFISKKVVIQ